ncbi:MAG: hypothetical protein LQ351_004976 [Letrouitia transgressa]|nr:MAG: hypothetical protein LQ351_004976 [Letrouitia transgressa]
MILRGSRVLTRLPQWGTPCAESRSIALLALNIERALPLTAGLKSCNGKPEECCSFAIPSAVRTYATEPVSRPKAHTGRTASAPRKKTTTTSKAKPAKRAKRISASKKGKPKAKPRTRARSTKARTKAKAKPKPKRKVLTDEQKAALKKKKEATQLRLLKATALAPPKKLPGTAWSVYLAESVKSNKGPIGSRAKEASSEYKALAPGQRESYNHTANQNKTTNASQYQKWILSFTPSQIYEANHARSQLRRLTTKAWYKLHDERLVKRQKSAYNLFHSQRYSSGDFQGLKLTEAAKLIGEEWKRLSTNEKKACDLPSLWIRC